MSLLDFLKKKKSKGQKKEEKREEILIKKEEKVQPLKEEKGLTTKKPKRGVLNYDIIEKPHISEKSTYLAKENQYIFQVNSKANKTEIKKAIEGIYGIDVISIKIIKIPSKKRRLGSIEGLRKGYKKAIVKIKEGQKIEII